MPEQQRRRKSVDHIARNAMTFLAQRDAATIATREKNKARDYVQEFTLPDPDNEELNPNEVRIDEDGHRYYDFDTPVTINGVEYRGLRNQRKISEYVDMSKVESWFSPVKDEEISVEELLRRKKLRDIVLKPVTTYEYDIDELYRLNQQGLLSDDELDSFTTADVGWSLCVVKA
jgi:hypothetical protein